MDYLLRSPLASGRLVTYGSAAPTSAFYSTSQESAAANKQGYQVAQKGAPFGPTRARTRGLPSSSADFLAPSR